MIEIIKNKNNLEDKNITKTITRVKALIINSKKELLLGHSFCEYQFPGGHVKDSEDLLSALKRELKEETGLNYEVSKLRPIASYTRYYKDYPLPNENTKMIIYYYEIFDDRIPNLSNTNYTAEEKDGKFTLRYIPLNIVEDVLKDNIILCGDVQGIAQEMLELFSYYFNKNV